VEVSFDARSFVRATKAAGAFDPSPVSGSSGATRRSEKIPPMSEERRGWTRRALFGAGAVGGAAALTRPAPPNAATPSFEGRGFGAEQPGIDALQEKMRSGEETAVSLCAKLEERIASMDRRGPALRSVLEINPDALSIAAALDAERREKRIRGPLHGIPVLLKDNIATADRLSTAAGSLALEGLSAPAEAFVVRRLREAGAVVLGKTNLSEWANFRSTHSSSGWSGRGGQCRNPYALDRSPSGSSSGSAVAVACGFAPAALGSETDGSIVSPSNNCGLVGVKPTVGLVSRSGIIPIAHSQDTAGPMTRTVREAALLLATISGRDPLDPTTGEASARRAGWPALEPGALKGARLGLPRKSLFGYHPGVDRLAEEAIAALRSLGAVIVDPADIATVDDLAKNELEVLLYEFKADVNAYLARLDPASPVRSLEDLIAFNERHRDREMPFFGQELFEKAEAKGPLTEKAYLDALAGNIQASREKGIDATMNAHRLDALVAPTGPPASLIDLINGDYGAGGTSTVPAVAGYPHVTVPMGQVFGLPVGLSFFGRAWSDAKLLSYAYAFEQATRHRRPPRFLPTAELPSDPMDGKFHP
jgi:amidase